MIRPVAKTATAATALLALSGCELLFPEDPREGSESAEACVTRLAAKERDLLAEADAGDTLVPTYTYDITKVSLEDLQVLTAAGADETAGSRERRQTNQAATAVDNFMAAPVDEKGAFYMGRDPALYRVRGDAMAAGEIAKAGCEQQKTGMRLIDFTASAARAEPEPDASGETDNSGENENQN